MVAFLLGAAACAETPEPAQDDSIEATRTRANAGGGALTDENFFTAVALWLSDEVTATSREAAGGGTGRIMDLLLTGVSNPSYRP